MAVSIDGAAADGEDRVERPGVAGELDRLGHRLVGRLDAAPGRTSSRRGRARRPARRSAPGGRSRRRRGRSPAAPGGRRTAARSWPTSAEAPGPNFSAGRGVGEDGLAHRGTSIGVRDAAPRACVHQVEHGPARRTRSSATGTHATASVVPSASTTRGSASSGTWRRRQVHAVEVLDAAATARCRRSARRARRAARRPSHGDAALLARPRAPARRPAARRGRCRRRAGSTARSGSRAREIRVSSTVARRAATRAYAADPLHAGTAGGRPAPRRTSGDDRDAAVEDVGDRLPGRLDGRAVDLDAPAAPARPTGTQPS